MLKFFLLGYITCSLLTFLVGTITNDEITGMRFCVGWFIVPLRFIFTHINKSKLISRYLHKRYTRYDFIQDGLIPRIVIVKNKNFKNYVSHFTDKTTMHISKNQDFDLYTFFLERESNKRISKILKETFDI